MNSPFNVRIWTFDEDALLGRLVKGRRSAVEIAERMNRSEHAVRCRMASLGLRFGTHKKANDDDGTPPIRRQTPITAEERRLFGIWEQCVMGESAA